MSTYNVRTNFVTLKVIHVSEKYPKGAFSAVVKREGYGVLSKQASLNAHGAEDAFEVVDLWAEDRAKEFGLPYEKVSLNRLNELFSSGSQRFSANEKRQITLKEKPSLGHIGYFKADIKRAFATEGYERVKQVIAHGLELLEELETERARVSKNSHGAKVAVAKVMYETLRDTGVDTSIYCSDEEILTQFKRFQEEDKQAALI